MRLSRLIVLVAALLLGFIAVWCWWVRPQKVDMAAYAPADSLLYLEANRPLDLVEKIAETDAWKAFEKVNNTPPNTPRRQWLENFVRWTGIGPTQSVILSRAQIAVVVTDLNAKEAEDTLRVKPEGAILIETHTAEGRIRPLFEQTLKTLAEKTYGRTSSRKLTIDGAELIEWIAPDSSRQIVGTVAGTLVIIGTSEQVVQSCLAVSRGQRPSLKADPELNRMRLQLGDNQALSFGYVPAGKSARLLAVGIPLLMGRAPGDSEFQRLIENGAAKVFGSIGWSSKPYLTAIEDRYLINLQPPVVTRLKPNFGSTGIDSLMQQVVPSNVYSVTSYSFADPAAAWQSLKTAVSSQVDALSTIVFSSLLKSALLSYGIDEPEKFLGAINGEILTMRLDRDTESSLLVAGVRDRAVLREILKKKLPVIKGLSGAQGVEIFEDSGGDTAASLGEKMVVMGTPIDVRHYAERGTNESMSTEELNRITSLASSSNRANVVTYTNDESRVNGFFGAVVAAKESSPATPARRAIAITGLPYAVTETILGDRGLERTTRSPLGQFSALLPLLIPEQNEPVKGGNPAR